MEQRLSAVTLGVADLERARRFYADGLGWRPEFVHHEVVFFQLGGIVLALYGRAGMAGDLKLEPERLGVGAINLAHNVRTRGEVDEVMALAAAAGATVLNPAHDTSWGGRAGYFADPDGHPWEVAWNPGWVLEVDGSVRLGPPAL